MALTSRDESPWTVIKSWRQERLTEIVPFCTSKMIMEILWFLCDSYSIMALFTILAMHISLMSCIYRSSIALDFPPSSIKTDMHCYAVVTPLRKATSYEPRIAILGIWGDTWLTRGKYGIYVAVRCSYGTLKRSTWRLLESGEKFQNVQNSAT